jgi:hypothetical protein
MHVDKLAFAVSLLDGAARIASTATTDAIGEIGIPFFLLLGFSVENGLKAYLEKQGVAGNWKHSHDLTDLYQKAASAGFAPPSGVDTFVISLSQYHKDFWFRYPEKAGTANVFKAASSINAVQTLLEEVADLIGAQDIFRSAATRGVKP